jgi:hypothetical protein
MHSTRKLSIITSPVGEEMRDEPIFVVEGSISQDLKDAFKEIVLETDWYNEMEIRIEKMEKLLDSAGLEYWMVLSWGSHLKSDAKYVQLQALAKIRSCK